MRRYSSIVKTLYHGSQGSYTYAGPAYPVTCDSGRCFRLSGSVEGAGSYLENICTYSYKEPDSYSALIDLTPGVLLEAFGNPPAICLSPSETSKSWNERRPHWARTCTYPSTYNHIDSYVDWEVTVEKISNCPPPLVVKAMEVTQAIQDWNNSVPLVEGKDTYVRAFITTCPGNSANNIPVKAQLRGYRVSSRWKRNSTGKIS